MNHSKNKEKDPHFLRGRQARPAKRKKNCFSPCRDEKDPTPHHKGEALGGSPRTSQMGRLTITRKKEKEVLQPTQVKKRNGAVSLVRAVRVDFGAEKRGKFNGRH